LADVFAFELGDELVEPLLLGFNADRVKELLDVRSGWARLSPEGKEQVRCEVLHC